MLQNRGCFHEKYLLHWHQFSWALGWIMKSLEETGKIITLARSSRSEVIVGKGVLKIYSRFIEEHPCRIVIIAETSICEQIHKKLQTFSYLSKKSLTENFHSFCSDFIFQFFSKFQKIRDTVFWEKYPFKKEIFPSLSMLLLELRKSLTFWKSKYLNFNLELAEKREKYEFHKNP